MQFILRINAEGAAFDGADDDYGPGPEVARLLRDLADEVDFNDAPEHMLKLSGPLRDFNGNTCGKWAFGTGSFDAVNGVLVPQIEDF